MLVFYYFFETFAHSCKGLRREKLFMVEKRFSHGLVAISMFQQKSQSPLIRKSFS
ncbi:hypothetical protein BREVNS_0563 [Brevinematales bacterium NS]|nr:hypothetical protein BREVNS_0563 [Brevinematales bacterium NS]